MTAAVCSDSIGTSVGASSCVARIEQSPGHRPNLVESGDSLLDGRSVHDTGAQEKPEVAVDFRSLSEYWGDDRVPDAAWPDVAAT